MPVTIEDFERCCRLCAKEQDVTIMLFSEQAEVMLLKKKLNKYLLIEVDEDDKLPKNICVKCCSKLQTVCEFIDQASKAQEILHEQSLILENKPQVDIEPENSIIVKSEKNDDFQCTPMEISVDPMVVLQNSEDVLSPNSEENGENHEQDVTHLHGVDGKDVTIKLIRRVDNTLNSTEHYDSDPKAFSCLLCCQGFQSEIALKNHSWMHKPDNEQNNDIKPFMCSCCSDRFDNKKDFVIHLQNHNESGVCLICGRRFRTESNLTAHMEEHKSNSGKLYTCKTCGRSYNTSSNLKTHSVTHSNERPYKCSYCKKSFKRNQDLKFHVNQHTGEKPYKCPFCDKRFASSGNCYSHRTRMHPGRRTDVKIRKRTTISKSIATNQPLQFRPIAPKPYPILKGSSKYQCTICEHSFLKRDNFNYHMYQHTGEKPFQCSLCNEKFVTRRGLLIHHDKTHPAKNRPLALLSRNALLK